jgi:hypothetical protein
MIIKIDENTYIKYNEITKTSTTLDLNDLVQRKEDLLKRKTELEDYSDESLLAWAKRNFPLENEQKEKIAVDIELNIINNNLNEINGN